MTEQRNPSPTFYKIIAVIFLVIGVALIWQAVGRHDWRFWVFGILTIVNAMMSALKSLVPRETKN